MFISGATNFLAFPFASVGVCFGVDAFFFAASATKRGAVTIPASRGLTLSSAATSGAPTLTRGMTMAAPIPINPTLTNSASPISSRYCSNDGGGVIPCGNLRGRGRGDE